MAPHCLGKPDDAGPRGTDKRLDLVPKSRKAEVVKALGDFRFGGGFGATLSRLLRAGIGVHHAGMLPRYRRLVERLARS